VEGRRSLRLLLLDASAWTKIHRNRAAPDPHFLLKISISKKEADFGLKTRDFQRFCLPLG